MSAESIPTQNRASIPGEPVPSFGQPEDLQYFDYTLRALGNTPVLTAESTLYAEMTADSAQDKADYVTGLRNGTGSDRLGAEADQTSEAAEQPQRTRLQQFAGRLLGRKEAQVVPVNQKPGELTTEQKELAAETDTNALLSVADWYRGSAKSGHELIGEELQAVQSKLTDLSPDQSTELNKYIERNASDFLKSIHNNSRMIDGTPHLSSWTTWLTSPENGGASDEQLLNFLQWHTDRIRETESSPMVAAEIATTREHYGAAAEKAAQEGWLLPLSDLQTKKIQSVEVRFGDYLDTIMQDRLGYAPQRQNEVVIAAGEGRDKVQREAGSVVNMRSALMHEFNHAVIQDFTKDDPTWLYEAATEHISLAFDGGNPDTFDPARAHPNKTGVYREERDLVSTLLELGKNRLPGRLVTRDYSGGEAERTALAAALDASWGVPDVIGKVDARMDEVMEEVQIEQPNMTAIRVMGEAARRVSSDLSQQPEVVFGKLVR